jgi:hypothetical protein
VQPGTGEAALDVPALVTVLGEAESGNEPTTDKASAAGAPGRNAPGASSADQAVAALTAALKSGSGSARRAAIQELPSFGHASAGAVPMISALKESDPNPQRVQGRGIRTRETRGWVEGGRLERQSGTPCSWREPPLRSSMPSLSDNLYRVARKIR